MPTRRSFLQLASASAAVVIGFDPQARAFVTDADTGRPFERLPPLEGTLRLDQAAREAMAQDVGRNLRRVPVAVLEPRSAEDVASLVRYANSHGLRVAMRGQGHSQYGQSLVEGGVVIDSRSLAGVTLAGSETAVAQAGASWGETSRVTLTQGLTPRVMGDVMSLSVGGVLSVGGWGHRSHHFGAVADSVVELQVVTGDGRLLHCSEDSQRELFEMTLAGLGQVGLIVSARLRLERAPETVVRRELVYEDLERYVADSRRLAVERAFDHQAAKAYLRGDGGALVRVDVGVFSGGAERDLEARLSGLGFSARGELRRTSYWDYLQREAPTAAALQAARDGERRRSASLVVFVPASRAVAFAKEAFADKALMAGLWRSDFSPLVNPLFKRPLFKLPGEPASFSLWLFRNALASEPAAHAAMIAANQGLLAKLRTLGGKAYPPYVSYSAADWREHYGEETWQRLTAAKQRFDPRGVLTPGPGVFSAQEVRG